MPKPNKEYTLEDEIRDAMNPEEPKEAAEDVPVESEGEEVTVAAAESAELPTPAGEPAPTEIEAAPTALSGSIKAKWSELPEDVRAEWRKRESDIHEALTRHDGDRITGRTIKEIAAPYEAVIRAEGGTVEGAFKDLLNSAYILRTGSPQQKAQMLMQAAAQYNVDLSGYFAAPQEQQDPIYAMQQELAQLRHLADPARLTGHVKGQIREEMEADQVRSEVAAFAANPAYPHFAAVKSLMGSLMASGAATDLQDAYEKATWSVPSIRADLLRAQQAQEAEKRKAEIAAKKSAAASVAGSPGVASPQAHAHKQSLEDELRERLRASAGRI